MKQNDQLPWYIVSQGKVCCMYYERVIFNKPSFKLQNCKEDFLAIKTNAVFKSKIHCPKSLTALLRRDICNLRSVKYVG